MESLQLCSVAAQLVIRQDWREFDLVLRKEYPYHALITMDDEVDSTNFKKEALSHIFASKLTMSSILSRQASILAASLGLIRLMPSTGAQRVLRKPTPSRDRELCLPLFRKQRGSSLVCDSKFNT